MQTYKQEKLKKLREDFNSLSEVAEELTSLVQSSDYDQEETALHRLDRVLNEAEKKCEESYEPLAKAVGEWRSFMDELEAAKEEIQALYKQVEELTDKVGKTKEENLADSSHEVTVNMKHSNCSDMWKVL